MKVWGFGWEAPKLLAGMGPHVLLGGLPGCWLWASIHVCLCSPNLIRNLSLRPCEEAQG